MALDQAVIGVFGPPPPSVKLDDSRVTQDNAVVITLLGIATVAVVLRFVARFSMQQPLKTDDWLIIVSLLFVCATTGLSIEGGTFGAGKHVWSVTLPGLTNIFQILLAYTFAYAGACSACKASILFFYRRVFVIAHQDLFLRVSLLVGFFLTLSYPVIVSVTMGNSCNPLSYFWSQFSGGTGKCIDTNTLFLASGILNMVNDIVVLLVPFPQITRLQMNSRKKIAICAILALGSFGCIASVVRIYFVHQFGQSADVTWMMGPLFIWSTIEPAVAIVCACLPHLAPLARLAHIKLSSSYGPKSPYPSTPRRSRRSRTPSHQKGTLFGNRGKGGRLAAGEIYPQGFDDEIGLTSQVTSSVRTQKPHSIASGSHGSVNAQSIVVQSGSRI
ncbi:hypothetical protein ABOM_000376 [Aspergillus bombycis]|uniref:Rhodopsin domain-containing protein n=1 Tax=Aspergillus bombycis TaxID=109264 RepID=A0A1F8AHF2_9EURO|nr:hypothetical protein ABOM_000376 [Aspergillus bombycis]OGM51082.1 hypothetical protein ABOM_000376 [Aspergillus bombycis]